MSFFETEEYLQRYIIAIPSLFKQNEYKYLELFKHHISTKPPRIEVVDGKFLKRVYPFRIEMTSRVDSIPTNNKKVSTNIRFTSKNDENNSFKVEVIIKIGDAARFTSSFSILGTNGGEMQSFPRKVRGGYSDYLSNLYKEIELHDSLVDQIVNFIKTAIDKDSYKDMKETNPAMDDFINSLIFNSRMNFLLEEYRLEEAEELFLSKQNGGNR